MIGTGIDVRVKIQDIVSSQLPEFIVNESPLTQDFLKQFYISQEFQGGSVDIVSNLDQYLDLNTLSAETVAAEYELTEDIDETADVVRVEVFLPVKLSSKYPVGDLERVLKRLERVDRNRIHVGL